MRLAAHRPLGTVSIGHAVLSCLAQLPCAASAQSTFYRHDALAV